MTRSENPKDIFGFIERDINEILLIYSEFVKKIVLKLFYYAFICKRIFPDITFTK